jgi:hypothetical protein
LVSINPRQLVKDSDWLWKNWLGVSYNK